MIEEHRLEALHGTYVGLVNSAIAQDRYDLVVELVDLFGTDLQELGRAG